jgi:hypothetical protein
MSPLPAPTFPLFQVRDGDGWQKVSARETYADPYIQIERADYLTPGRPNQPVPWTIAHRKAAVAIAPVLEDGRYLLIAQERLPVQDTLWEFPAGQIDIANSPTPHQTIIDTALAELRLTVEAPAETATALAQKLRSTFSLRIPVTAADPGTLPTFEVKAKRWNILR